jgi:hypothetical protein
VLRDHLKAEAAADFDLLSSALARHPEYKFCRLRAPRRQLGSECPTWQKTVGKSGHSLPSWTFGAKNV